MLELLGRLAKVPARAGGILDLPFDEYAKDIASPRVVSLLEGYARPHGKPTLRAILADTRFRRWVEVSGRSPVRKELEEELAIVCDVTEEEYILDEEQADRPEPPQRAEPTLREWAERAGVTARLTDPVTALASRANGAMRHVLRFARATVADVLDGTFDGLDELAPSHRRSLVSLAEAYVREAGERALADRREAARIAALAHVPEGEGARAFIAALDAAIARLQTKKPPDAFVTSITLEREPTRIEVQAQWSPRHGGGRRNRSAALLLDDWRLSPLEAKIVGTKKIERLVLHAVRRVLGDPRHPLHERLVAYLNEPPWTRVLANLDALAKRGALRERPEVSVEWHVLHDRNVQLVPFVGEGRHEGGAVYRSSVEAIVGGHAGPVSARDEAVARALYAPRLLYAYGLDVRDQNQSRERTFHALSLLAGHPEVSSRAGRLHVHEGALGVALEREAEGFRFVFDVAGERLAASELRAALDAAGYLIHVDPANARVLVAYVGTQQAAALAAIMAEDAVFPLRPSPAFVERVLALHRVLPLRLPVELAGEAVEADARPHVRLVREGVDSLSLSWLVRPIASGPTFVPGRGPDQVLHRVDGRTVFATRSREDEQMRLDALRGRLPAPLATGPLTDARCRGIDTVLAVAEILRAAVESGQAVVEWPKSLPRIVGSASWSKLRLQVTAQRDWFGVNGVVEIDGAQVTLAELLAAQRLRERFVVLGPDKLVAIEDELRSRLEALDTIARPSKTGLELVNAAVPALADLFSSRDQLDAAPAFWSLLARVDAARTSEPKVPRSFAKILRSYQVEGFRWMSRLAAWGAGACLADEMGLGKTVQALALLVARSKEGPSLVIAPTSVGPNWIHEAQRFAPSMNAILHRGADRAAALAELGPGDLLVTSYDILVRDQEALSKIPFGTLVVDEAQAIKNGATARARAARALRAEFRLALTGTPVENRLAELYSLMEFLNPGFFGSEDQFRARYVVPIERDKDAARSDALARLVRPFLLRRRKAEVLSELPARTEIARPVERSPAERKLYEAARRVALAALSGADEDARFQILAEIMRLRRLACHPRLYDEASNVPSSKLEAFLALVSELREGGHRALVFSQFTGHLALVEEALRANAVPYLYLDGKTPLAERTRRVAAFQSGQGDLFLISLKAGGTGLNLTAADTVIHLDPWWNPAVEDQATDRAHRIGQTRPVTVIRLIAQGTIEEAVLALHAEKRELAEAILEGSAASGKLSIAELGALIREGAAAG